MSPHRAAGTMAHPLRPTLARIFHDIVALPTGRTCAITAGPGYDTHLLSQALRRREDVPTLWIRPTADADLDISFRNGSHETLTRDAALSLLQRAASTPIPGLTVLFEEGQGQRFDEEAAAYIAALAPAVATVVGIGDSSRVHAGWPGRYSFELRVGQAELAITEEDLGDPRYAAWSDVARATVLDHAMGWPMALQIVAGLVESGAPLDDGALMRAGVSQMCAPTVRADFADGSPDRALLLQLLADSGPVSVADLIWLDQPRLVSGLRDLSDHSAVMTAQDPAWRVSPLARDVLTAAPLVDAPSRAALAVALAESEARRGDPVKGLQRLARARDDESESAYIAQWAVRAAQRGDPEVSRILLHHLPQDRVLGRPDLVFAHAVTDMILVELANLRHWLEVLELHADPSQQGWDPRNPRVPTCLAQIAELEPPGAEVRAALSGPNLWAGYAHLVIGIHAHAAGDIDRAGAALDSLGRLRDDSVVVRGWRQALLMDVYLATGREEEAVAIYRRIAPQLEVSKYADMRLTFFLDAALGRSAVYAGDRTDAVRLARRSLAKTAGIRVGVPTTRLGALVLDAQTFAACGELADLATAIDVARPLVAALPEATAFADEITALTARLTARSAAASVPGRGERAGGIPGPDRGAPGRLTPHGEIPLTATQYAVLGHLASPYPVLRIAQLMAVSPTTVRTHIRAIYRALEVTSRAEAVDRAREIGLLAGPGGLA